jgi:hypothetical protein
VTHYEPAERRRELTARAIDGVCEALYAMVDGRYRVAARHFADAEEDACYALAWHFQIVGDREHIEAQLNVLLAHDEERRAS